MTLEELQAEFPHGSRWFHVMVSGFLDEITVLGWHPEDRQAPIIACYSDGSIDQFPVSTFKSRIPDPTPCPITEPVTLYSYARHGGHGYITAAGPFDEDGGHPPITLHPDGRYTWEGGPE